MSLSDDEIITWDDFAQIVNITNLIIDFLSFYVIT